MLETVFENIPHLKVEENRTLADWVGITDDEVKKCLINRRITV